MPLCSHSVQARRRTPRRSLLIVLSLLRCLVSLYCRSVPLRPREAAKKGEALRRRALRRCVSNATAESLADMHSNGLARLLAVAKHKLKLPGGGDVEQNEPGSPIGGAEDCAGTTLEGLGSGQWGLAGTLLTLRQSRPCSPSLAGMRLTCLCSLASSPGRSRRLCRRSAPVARRPRPLAHPLGLLRHAARGGGGGRAGPLGCAGQGCRTFSAPSWLCDGAWGGSAALGLGKGAFHRAPPSDCASHQSCRCNAANICLVLLFALHPGCGKTTYLAVLAGSLADLGSSAVVTGGVEVDGHRCASCFQRWNAVAAVAKLPHTTVPPLLCTNSLCSRASCRLLVRQSPELPSSSPRILLLFHCRRRKSQVAYVPQSDVLIPSLTVQECLRYSALLRLPQDTSPLDLQASGRGLTAPAMCSLHGMRRRACASCAGCLPLPRRRGNQSIFLSNCVAL